MNITFILLLSVLSLSNTAYAERSYLMIPDAVEQAEELSKAANTLGRDDVSQRPKTVHEAMNHLHRIDKDMDRIILLARRFQQTSRLLDRGIRDTQNFAYENSAFVTEWGPVLRGNYQLIQAAFKVSDPDDMRTIVALSILEKLLDSISMRIESAHTAMHLQLQFSKEASVINAARQRLHDQLTEFKQSLNTIRNTARARM